MNLRRGTAGLGPALGRGGRLDRPPLPVHLSARPDPRPDALGHGRARPPRRARHRHVLHLGRRRRAARERERRSGSPADGDGPIATHLIGPRNPKDRADLRLDDRDPPRPGRGGGSSIRSAGTPAELEVREGRWSDWLRVKFKVGLLQTVRGIVRFHLVRLGPELRALRLAGQLRPRGPAVPDQPPAGLRRRARRRHRAVPHDGDGRGPRRAEQRAVRRGGVPRPVRRSPGASARR